MLKDARVGRFLDEMLVAFPGARGTVDPGALTVSGAGSLPAWFDVTDLATAAIGTAALMVARLAALDRGSVPPVTVDRRLASLWFGMTLRPEGWQMPPVWDAIAGDYRTRDGWIRLHTNAPRHRAAALAVLGRHAERAALEPAVAAWAADELEAAIVEAGGCAAAMRDLDAWTGHPQGLAVSREPLVLWQDREPADTQPRSFPQDRPLAGVRVLDLTRVLAGPVAGRFLAAYGAKVLRIDPPDWDEPGVVPDVTLGKRCAGLDLAVAADRAVFEDLLGQADVLLHGLRPGALAGLGYGPEALRRFNPHLIDVCLDAYGWSGPWAERRGFDSLVQMSSGIADHGMRMSGADRPVPLPVQALDHATGYLLAAAVLHALSEQAASGRVLSARLSLARTALMLTAAKRSRIEIAMPAGGEDDLDPLVEATDWGPARRVRFPVSIAEVGHGWDRPAGRLRSAPAQW